MMLSDAAVRAILREYVSRVREAGIPVLEVRLFGSRARGTAQEYSDIDVCIISPVFGKDRLEEMDTLLTIAARMKSQLPIEPIPFAPGDIDDRYSTLATEIREQGKRVEV